MEGSPTNDTSSIKRFPPCLVRRRIHAILRFLLGRILLRVVHPEVRVVLIALTVPFTFNGSSTVLPREGRVSLCMDRRLPPHQFSLDERTRPGTTSEGCTGRRTFSPVRVSQSRLFHVGEEVSTTRAVYLRIVCDSDVCQFELPEDKFAT